MRKREFYVPAETEGDLLEQAKPHWVGAAVGLLTAAASAYASAKQQGATRRNTRNAAALSGLNGGQGASSSAPTALTAMAQSNPDDINKTGLADLLNKSQQGAQFNELPADKPPTGYSADAKPPAPGSAAQAPGTQDPDSHMFGGQNDQKPPDNTNSYLNAATSLAGLAQGLAQRPPMQGAPIPQPGPMNFQPTALAQLAARRNPYGGY